MLPKVLHGHFEGLSDQVAEAVAEGLEAPEATIMPLSSSFCLDAKRSKTCLPAGRNQEDF